MEAGALALPGLAKQASRSRRLRPFPLEVRHDSLPFGLFQGRSGHDVPDMMRRKSVGLLCNKRGKILPLNASAIGIAEVQGADQRLVSYCLTANTAMNSCQCLWLLAPQILPAIAGTETKMPARGRLLGAKPQIAQ